MNKTIEISHLRKTFKGGVTALNDVSLVIGEGELFGLLGVNGAGKTTLVKILCCLTRPTEGTATVCGHDVVTDAQEVKQIIDLSPQETSVAPNLTVRENLEFFAQIYDKNTPEHVQNVMDTFSLGEVADRRADKLSGGWKRRLSIAVALISEPQVLFLDEPTLGLDVLARRELWKIIEKLKGKITIVLTSHYLEEIEALCDRVAVLSSGKLLDVGTTEELKQKTGADSFENAFVSIVEAAK